MVYDRADKEIFNANIYNILDSLYPNREITFAAVEQPPIFPGCENLKVITPREYFNYQINEHIKKYFIYPEIAKDLGIQGRVLVQFVINQDGYIENIRTRGPDINLEKAAKDIILKLPKLKPGLSNGKAVRVPFAIPITFKLQ